MPKNIEAIQEWVNKNRPELSGQIEQILLEQDDGPFNKVHFLLLCIGFEAGRQFQQENPTAPSGPEAYY